VLKQIHHLTSTQVTAGIAKRFALITAMMTCSQLQPTSNFWVISSWLDWHTANTIINTFWNGYHL